MKSQFIRVETYAKKSRKANERDISGVIAEAARITSHSKHVSAPNVEKVYGYSLSQIFRQLNNGYSQKINNRKVSETAKALLAGVVSYPVAYSDNPCECELKEWRKKTLIFLKKEFGDNLKSVIEHKDEKYPHLHFYCFDTGSMNTINIHPGKIAEKAVSAKSKRAKDKAYSQAMTAFQDRYYEDVSYAFDIARSSNNVRDRISREQILQLNQLKESEQLAREKAELAKDEKDYILSAGKVLNKRFKKNEAIRQQLQDVVRDLTQENIELKNENRKLKSVIDDLRDQVKQAFQNGVDYANKAWKRLKNQAMVNKDDFIHR